MDGTALGALLVGLGTVAAAVVSFIGKRGENSTTRMTAEMDQVQEERDGLRVQLAARDDRITELLQERLDDQRDRLADQVEIARLRVKIIELGGQP